jgi:hypothetical protein
MDLSFTWFLPVVSAAWRQARRTVLPAPSSDAELLSEHQRGGAEQNVVVTEGAGAE